MHCPGKWIQGACFLFLAGCSTHPLVDVLDYVAPGKVEKGTVAPHGGVCIPQGPVQPPGPIIPAVPAITVPVVTVPVVPPPAPLPGPAPPPNFPGF